MCFFFRKIFAWEAFSLYPEKRLIRQPTAATFSHRRRLVKCMLPSSQKAYCTSAGFCVIRSSKKRLCLRQISLLRREKVSRLAATDEALSHAYFQSKLRLAVFAPVLRPIFLPYLLSLPILIYFMSLKTDKKAKQSFSCEKAFPFYGRIYLRIICKQIKIFAFLS